MSLRCWELTSLRCHDVNFQFDGRQNIGIRLINGDTCIKIKTLEIKRYARKRIFHGCLVRIEKSVPLDYCLASVDTAS